MSTRSLIELNHDHIPRDNDVARVFGMQLRNYMRASDPAELPKGVRLIARRHHSDPEFAAGWQPIETAPKDGTHVDLWVNLTYAGMKFRETNCWYETGKWRYFEDWTSETCVVDGATHWMPLPEPPHDP